MQLFKDKSFQSSKSGTCTQKTFYVRNVYGYSPPILISEKVEFFKQLHFMSLFYTRKTVKKFLTKLECLSF
jgi:hypothetical protein